MHWGWPWPQWCFVDPCTPLPPKGCHPELDNSDLLLNMGIQKYPKLIGMAQWACTIGWLDIAFAVLSLSQFLAAPCEHHLVLGLHLFGYLKKNPNRQIVQGHCQQFSNGIWLPTGNIIFFRRQPCTWSCYTPFYFSFDSCLLGIHVISCSKRQGCIATSTYIALNLYLCAAMHLNSVYATLPWHSSN